jgi:hypothetical protein
MSSQIPSAKGDGLQLGTTTHVSARTSGCHRLIDRSPFRHIFCPIDIGIFSMSTYFANKLRLALSIGFLRVTTSTTGSTRVARVNCDYWNASNLSFVFDKLSQFIETPLSKSLSIGFPNRCSKAVQVFQTDSSLSAFSQRDNLFADRVIGVSLKSAFSARQFLQVALGVFRAFGLQRLLEFVNFAADIINVFTAEMLPIRSRGEIDSAHIDAKIAKWFDLRSIWQVNDQTQKETALAVGHIGLFENAALFKFSILPKDHRDFISSVDGKNGSDGQIGERKQSVIIDNCRVFLEFVAVFLLAL